MYCLTLAVSSQGGLTFIRSGACRRSFKLHQVRALLDLGEAGDLVVLAALELHPRLPLGAVPALGACNHPTHKALWKNGLSKWKTPEQTLPAARADQLGAKCCA